MTDRSPLRHHALTVGLGGDRCDGCGMTLLAGIVAQYRLDGAVFCNAACAHVHQDIELDLSGRKSA